MVKNINFYNLFIIIDFKLVGEFLKLIKKVNAKNNQITKRVAIFQF